MLIFYQLHKMDFELQLEEFQFRYNRFVNQVDLVKLLVNLINKDYLLEYYLIYFRYHLQGIGRYENLEHSDHSLLIYLQK